MNLEKEEIIEVLTTVYGLKPTAVGPCELGSKGFNNFIVSSRNTAFAGCVMLSVPKDAAAARFLVFEFSGLRTLVIDMQSIISQWGVSIPFVIFDRVFFTPALAYSPVKTIALGYEVLPSFAVVNFSRAVLVGNDAPATPPVVAMEAPKITDFHGSDITVPVAGSSVNIDIIDWYGLVAPVPNGEPTGEDFYFRYSKNGGAVIPMLQSEFVPQVLTGADSIVINNVQKRRYYALHGFYNPAPVPLTLHVKINGTAFEWTQLITDHITTNRQLFFFLSYDFSVMITGASGSFSMWCMNDTYGTLGSVGTFPNDTWYDISLASDGFKNVLRNPLATRIRIKYH